MNGSSDAIRPNPAHPAEPLTESAAALARYCLLYTSRCV